MEAHSSIATEAFGGHAALGFVRQTSCVILWAFQVEWRDCAGWHARALEMRVGVMVDTPAEQQPIAAEKEAGRCARPAQSTR
jgi:hypothetical protein